MKLNTQNPKSQLTPRQLQLLKAIATFRTSRCYSPTIAELASQLGISRSTAFEHIAELQRKKLLCNCPGRARSLKPTSGAQKLLNSLTELNPDITPTPPTGIPLAGTVAAGLPLEAIENKDSLSLTS
ncbi:MAG: LexA family protein, partial [Planctomycetota bacterium]